MKLEKTPLEGLFIMHRPVRRDERGFFSRLFGADELAAAGRVSKAVHVNSSTSAEVGTLRGIHFQFPPHSEAKIVSCVAGAIWDVGIDLRPGSPTRFQWFGSMLTPSNGVSLIVPEGFGHAFITLEPNSTVVYVVSAPYALSHESGIRFDDPSIGIKWPIEPKVLSEKDRAWGLIERRMEEIDSGFANL
ncbi:MAG: dTDP-4-dehydrorhamnose 3,5-epimerase family protein [Spirochaetes bacterium]|nr:dTDP-4-dehydrorhamnose 3,5-epimerase family protein [Spirochaetota bacterium]